MIRKIFLDLGAHVGESVHYFRKHYGTEHEIFSFEALPQNIYELKQIDGIMVLPYAVSTFDGTAQFYIGLPQSGSLLKEKRSGGLDGKTHINVQTLDFAYWFKDLVSGDYVPEITIKMNIEGEEYPIIDKMDQWGLLPFVHRWFVNFHWKKIGLSKEEHDRISNLIEWESWPAMFE